MATLHSKTLKVAGAITFAGVLVGVLLPTVILPLLPPLPLITSQLLMRLREVAVFIAFTTAIAIGILSSQRKDTHHDKQEKLFLEHHPLGSIFGELGYEGADPSYADSGKHSISPLAKINEVDNGSVHGGSPLRMRHSEFTMEASQRRLANREENGNVGEHYVQRRLHRKSSSLDDSVSYVPQIEASGAGNEDYAHVSNNEQGNKFTKRVSFSMASSPSSPEHAANNQDIMQSRREMPDERQGDLTATSPGDISGQADAFIAKFKEQLRMQRLESFQRSRRRS